MTTKVYPDHLPRVRDKDGVWINPYRGTVSVMLTQEEVEHLMSILECLYGREDVSEELSDEIEKLEDQIGGIMSNGTARTLNLHKLLGAFDLHDDSTMTKPDSEKVNWPELRSKQRPKLEVVKP